MIDGYVERDLNLKRVGLSETKPYIGEGNHCLLGFVTLTPTYPFIRTPVRYLMYCGNLVVKSMKSFN